eukprot:11662753-Ditylum_brightwellii.AAC.1
MGNGLSNDCVKESEQIQTVVPSYLKLASQKIVDFSGRVEDWQKWKIELYELLLDLDTILS